MFLLGAGVVYSVDCEGAKMTWDEYNILFHKTQANLAAFQPLMQCDREVIRMIEAAVAAEREACAKVCEGDAVGDDPACCTNTAHRIADAIRARREQ